MESNQNAVDVVLKSDLAIAQMGPKEIESYLLENLGGEKIGLSDLEIVKNPGQGRTKWVVDGLEGETMVAELTGVIVAKRQHRAYWEKPMEEGGQSAPNCSSSDMIHGTPDDYEPGQPKPLCEDCPMNQWGSSPKGDGKACKETGQLIMCAPDSIIPRVVSIPPTGLKALKGYMMKLLSAKRPYYGVVTAIALKSETGKAGTVYSVPVFRVVRVLEEAEIESFAAFAKAFGSLMR